jgi:hypothetical protein
MTPLEKSARPGERWLVNLQPVDESEEGVEETTVTLQDFDPRTETWTVQKEGSAGETALHAKHLIRRVGS